MEPIWTKRECIRCVGGAGGPHTPSCDNPDCARRYQHMRCATPGCDAPPAFVETNGGFFRVRCEADHVFWTGIYRPD